MIKFGITFTFSLLLTVVFTFLTRMIDFALIRMMIQTYFGYTYNVLRLFAITNNTYQIFTHILTALKFGGISAIIPGGAIDTQSMIAFTFHNQLDLWGWFSYFLVMGEAQLIHIILAAAHQSVAVLILFDLEGFQDYYIRNGKVPLFFAIFRILFVLLDAGVRASAVFFLCQEKI